MIVTCPICGSVVPSIYVGSSGACVECRLAGFIPAWYQKAEKYEYVEQYGHANATRKPPTGIEWLDQGRVRICDALMATSAPARVRI
jgi:hypothetical protein